MIKYIFLTDFDATLIEKNSHEYLDELCSDKIFINKIQLKYEKDHLWFKRMDEFYKKIHQLNITPEQILKQYENISFVQGAIDFIKKIHCLGWFLTIISDGYDEVIYNVLQRNNLIYCFNQIVCNPNIWMKNKRLKIKNYAKDKIKIKQFHCQYGCPPNLCKGTLFFFCL
ncbi:unnamed protein product [Rotaria sp. Silwood2]|nr:unnamed protein product [Rotaria sp. Silwood2]CAF3137133.1 unnamed protein product [Rotaria sp. Silwood2]CAF4137812.1 unnamed protein product [Rotaria sp. Silwood2]CAF4527608.1 unnamed protein product [Rotaria sp. Silwood2]